MEKEELLQWLIKEKQMGMRSAKDVLSRCGRVLRILGITTLDDRSMGQLIQCDDFKNCSIFIKSQLKRSVVLCLEFMNLKERRN